MATPHGSTPAILGSIAIASMEALALVDQIKVSRSEKKKKNEEIKQGSKPTQNTGRNGEHRKDKKKGYTMSKIKIGMAILLMAHSGLGVVEAE